MKGEKLPEGASYEGTEPLSWTPVPNATYYKIQIVGHGLDWASDRLTATTFSLNALPLQPGNAYLVTVSAYMGDDSVVSATERALNVPALLKANSQSE